MHLRAVLLFFLASLGTVVPAHAGQWAMIEATENKPDRSAHFAQYSNVNSRFDPSLSGLPVPGKPAKKRSSLPPDPFENSQVMQVEVVEVFESAAKPTYSKYTFLVDCARARMRIEETDSYFRSGNGEVTAGTDWFGAPADSWLDRVKLIACDRPAIVAAANRGADTKSFEPLMELGLLYVGEFALPSQLVSMTWSTFWTDAVEPPYAELTAAQEAALRQDIDRRLKGLRDMIAGFIGTAETSLTDQTKEREFIASVRATFAKKRKQQQRIFLNMEGWTQAEVIDFWGRPTAVRTIGDVEAFEYYATVDNRQTFIEQQFSTDSKGVVNHIAEVEREVGKLHFCAMRLFLQPGGSKPGLRLIDYDIRGENCKRSTLGELVR